jgi:hypothetical protein
VRGDPAGTEEREPGLLEGALRERRLDVAQGAEGLMRVQVSCAL